MLAASPIDIEPVDSIHGLEPTVANPFFEEWVLEAALEHLAPPAAQVELVRVGDPRRAAVLPLVRSWGTPPGIGPVWAVWDHIHCFDTTPPENTDPDAVIDAVFDFLSRNGASMLRWTGLPTDTRFHEELIRHLERRGLDFQCTGTRLRPVLSADNASGPDGIAGSLEGKRMSEFRRRRRRLEELGKLEVRIHEGLHDPDEWMSHFLELEASGWKGANGTAIACRDNERLFFDRLMRGAAAQGKVLVCSLVLDGRPIAMTVNLRAGSGIWGFKTAYSSEFARFSPGVLVVSETTAHALRQPSITWLDSCMDHDDGPAGTLWHERRQVVDLLISAKPSANWLPRTASLALDAFRFVRNKVSPMWEPDGKRAQPLLARSGQSSISRIITGITSIVVLPEMPTVVLLTASI